MALSFLCEGRCHRRSVAGLVSARAPGVLILGSIGSCLVSASGYADGSLYRRARALGRTEARRQVLLTQN